MGYFFERESTVHVPCGCIMARDESDHTTQDTHVHSAKFVRRCALHEDADTSAPDVHFHFVSESVLRDHLSTTLGIAPEDIKIIHHPKTGHIQAEHLSLTAKALKGAAKVLKDHPRCKLDLLPNG